jgi:hypothetical protein
MEYAILWKVNERSVFRGNRGVIMSNQSRRDRKSRGNKAGSMAFGITLAIYFLFFHLGGFGGFIAGFFLAGLVSSIVRSMATGLELKANNNQSKERKMREAMPAQEVPVEKTGNSEVDAILEKGRRTIQQIREENMMIPDEVLTDRLRQLELLCGEIFRTVHDKPEKAPQIRKFMEYYLPTTLKIVSTYRVISERGIGGREIADARQRIEDALGTVIKGCQKLLGKLYQDDVLDITTDIDVLEQMLKRDGLTETELQLAADQARRAAEINAAVDKKAKAGAVQPEQKPQTGAAADGSQAQQTEY